MREIRYSVYTRPIIKPILSLSQFSVNFSLAQEDGALLTKSAGTALASYNSDPVNNSAKLAEATNLIEQALKTPEVHAIMSVWLTKGNIYKEWSTKNPLCRCLDVINTFDILMDKKVSIED